LKTLTPPVGHPQISVNSLMRQNAVAMCHLMANEEKIDFSHPGGHIYIHRGVEEGVKFIADTPEFKVADIPGDIGDDVRVALADKFLAAGFLYVVRP